MTSLIPFFPLFPCASLVWMFVCMYACLPALVRLFRSCRDPAKYYRELRIASAWRVLDTWECAMSMYPTRGTGSTVYIHSQGGFFFFPLSFFLPYCLSRMLFVGGRHFRSEFATKLRVATVVTGNEAQFRHTVWKLMFLLLKSTKICYFLNDKRLAMSCK